MRTLVLAASVAFAVALGACGDDDGRDGGAGGPAAEIVADPGPSGPSGPTGARGTTLVAALGDSITAGSPLYDPDPAIRERLGPSLDERSQWEYWVARREPGVRLRNCGVLGERTDQIAQRLESCARGAQVLVVQGGINDIAQGRPVADAADDLRSMIRRGRELGLRVATVELLPWNNGYPDAAPLVDDLNRRIRAIGREEGVPVYRWYRALEDPAAPGRMRADLTDDGDHPSVSGYRRLAELVVLP